MDRVSEDKGLTKKGILNSIIAAIAIMVIIAVLFQKLPDTNQKIRMIRLRLFLYRSAINQFFEDNEKYPDSVAELSEYMKPDLETELDSVLLKERITNPDGVSRESSVLDGKGGWYYNKATGELRFNITQPIKNYYKYYFGKYRNDIPCEW